MVSAVISSSVIPSLKYSFSGSALALTNGSTAIARASPPGKAVEAMSTVGSTSPAMKSDIVANRSAGVASARASARSTARGTIGRWADRDRRLDRVPGHGGAGAGSRERRLAGQHLVEHAREAVLVGAPVETALGAGLLRAHVRRSADGEAVIGDVDAVAAGGGDRGGDAEVGDDRLALLQQDVFRLDVAVDHLEPVGVGERAGDGTSDAKRHVERERTFALEPVAERLAAGVRHHEVQQAVTFAGIVQRQDLGVGQAGGDPDLPQEALRLVTGRGIGTKHLDGHFAGVLHILRQVDRGRSAPSDLLFDQVAVAEGGAQSAGDVGHDGLGVGPRGTRGRCPRKGNRSPAVAQAAHSALSALHIPPVERHGPGRAAVGRALQSCRTWPGAVSCQVIRCRCGRPALSAETPSRTMRPPANAPSSTSSVP